jgi:hypothetical protein
VSATVFDKLNLKDQSEIVVLNAPKSFETELRQLLGVNIRRKLAGDRPVFFALAFVQKQAELDSVATALTERADGDAILWFAYPKGTSKRYSCEFNRDTGWGGLRAAGFESVRMIAIDEDWSALRFRRAAFIKTMKRDAARAAPAGGRKPMSRPTGTPGKR